MKRFLYKDIKNRTTEALNYEPTDFISSFTGEANKPILTDANGFIDSSFIPATPASSLQDSKIASETIVKGDCVYATSDTTVGVATYNSTQDKALVLGIAANNASAGQAVVVILMGKITASIFSVFSLNRPLYLDEDGGITDTKPTISGYLTPVGKSLGSNSILINIGYPTKIGV